MGWSKLFKNIYSRGQYINSSRLKANKNTQVQAIPGVLDQLGSINILENEEIKLEYFFCTNKLEKAEKLAKDIRHLNYSVDYAEREPKKLFVITGWTTKIQMSNDAVSDWVKEMCELGFKHDCDFDGWGTDGRRE